MSGQTILVVEDERSISEVVSLYLTRAGYHVVTVHDGTAALRAYSQQKPALIVLDLMLPGVDGLEITRRVRAEGETPIIMLTARKEEIDRILGLEMGADDYVTKPFNVRELIARVRAVLRRAQKITEHEVLRVADITLDRTTVTVTVAGQPVELTKSEFELLAAFMSSPGQVFSRLDLLEHTSGDAYEGYERTIDVHIRNLRAKIEPDPKHPIYVETVYGMGYRFATQRPVTTPA